MSCILQIELGLVFWRQACQHAVEDVVVPLVGVLVDDSGFFQKVLLDFCALDCSGFVEENVDVLAEAG
jgi:hypothetical protein